MEGIYDANDSFDFSKIVMLSPVVVAGGNYFIKFRMNDIPLYIQTPKCKVKQGFMKSGKKIYCDLMFTRENEDFICWMENLENHCQKKIYENREKWFETKLDEHDIENSFTSPLKLYKSGKFYISRTNVPTLLGNCSLKIYNEKEELVSTETLKDDIDVISILEIQGIKCSARSFQIEIEIKQMLVLNPVNLFDKCILKKNTPYDTRTGLIAATESSATVISASSVADTTVADTTVADTMVADTMVATTSATTNTSANNDIDICDTREEPAQMEPTISNEVITNTEYESPNPDNNNNNDEDDENAKTNDDEDDDGDDEEDDEEYSDYENPRIVINHEDDLMEIDLDLDDFEEEVVNIKKRDDIYYEMYREAKRKAKLARDLAIASYLEAKNIKNTYMIVDEDSDLEEDTFQNIS